MKTIFAFIFFIFFLPVSTYANENTLPDDAPVETPILNPTDGPSTTSGAMLGPPPPPPAGIDGFFPSFILCSLIIGYAMCYYYKIEQKK